MLWHCLVGGNQKCPCRLFVFWPLWQGTMWFPLKTILYGLLYVSLRKGLLLKCFMTLVWQSTFDITTTAEPFSAGLMKISHLFRRDNRTLLSWLVILSLEWCKGHWSSGWWISSVTDVIKKYGSTCYVGMGRFKMASCNWVIMTRRAMQKINT